MRLLSVNRSTVLVELPSLDAVLALHADLKSRPLDGIEEMIPAAQTLMLRFDPARLSSKTLAETLPQRDYATQSTPAESWVEIPMRYDGEDLTEVANLTGLSVDEIIRRHEQSEFTVGFCGFAPGFAYLVGGDPTLHVARRPTPRTQVPAGAVALGGVYCGVYPQASPGGWQIIGTTTMTMWDPHRNPPAILTPGTRVRFHNLASGRAASPLPASVIARPAADGELRGAETAYLEVVTTPLPVLVQDLGRTGHASIGVTASGAMDRGSLVAANRAVGNSPNLPALEITFGSLSFDCSAETMVALSGAPVAIAVQRKSGERVDGAMDQPIPVQAGDRIKLGYPPRGVRTYLAVRGGFNVPDVLGSASRDTLSALGPSPLTKGSIIAIGHKIPQRKTPLIERTMVEPLPAADELIELEVTLGPRADWFSEASIAAFIAHTWRVTPQSSRVGLRLRGETALQRHRATELPSEGMCRGAIQVPHDGQPVLLLADHPVTGGYPVIAVVAEHHLDLAGQLPPGAQIRFRPINN